MAGPEDIARRWRERRVAQSRRDVELETFPTTSGSQALLAHPMFGAGRGQSPQSPVVPFEGAEVVMPVAWYHPLTIQQSGGTVTGWNDVSGFNRHMDAADDQTYDLEFGGTVDGRNGVIVPSAAGSSTSVANLFTPVFDQIAFPYGYTVFLVFDVGTAATDDPPIPGPAVDVSASSFLFRLQANDDPEFGQQYTGYGELIGDDTSVRGPTVLGLWEPWDGSSINMEVNGAPWVDGSGGSLESKDEPFGEQWVGFTNSFNVELMGAGTWFSEFIVIPAALSADGRRRWWQYLAAEYPSIF